ncbi:MAG TPA: ABC transporter ATP-binding protein [Solirubrobacteraceae bacterium]
MLHAELSHPLRDFVLDVALEVADGSCVALAGPSGAGKTTVLRAIAGLLRPRAGHVLCGRATWFDAERGSWVAPEDRRCGVVFQDYALFPHLTAWRNVAYGLRGPRRRERALRALEPFGAGHLADARPLELSGGERQRVALARALVIEPRALLLDEPLTALDTRTRAEATRELSAVLRATEVPSVVVTHDFAEASVLADEIAVMDAGRIVQHGPAAGLAGSPANAFVAGFTGASVLAGRARRRDDGLTEVLLDGGGVVVSTDELTGDVAAVVRPWDVSLAERAAHDDVSTHNRLPATVTAVTPLGTRARVALALPEPLAADVTTEASERLELRPGARTLATWKATVTRLVPR